MEGHRTSRLRLNNTATKDNFNEAKEEPYRRVRSSQSWRTVATSFNQEEALTYTLFFYYYYAIPGKRVCVASRRFTGALVQIHVPSIFGVSAKQFTVSDRVVSFSVFPL